MSNKTYKQRLIDLLTEEIKQEKDQLDKYCNRCFKSIHCINCVDSKVYRHNKSRLQTYIKQVNALPASAIIPRKFRHPIINSIYLFKPEIINKLYSNDNEEANKM